MRIKRIICFAVVLLAAVACTSCKAQGNKNVDVTRYSCKVEQVLLHDRSCYTQGLFFEGDVLYESGGQYKESCLKTVDMESGNSLMRTDLEDKYFAEGSCILDEKLYVLTWLEHTVFVYDPNTLELLETIKYNREGWGLTTDGKHLYATDGSSRIYEIDPQTFKDVRSVNVTYGSRRVQYLNELEWIDGKIWANVYGEDIIVIIDPKSGAVTGVVDCRGLLPDKLRDNKTDVFNGIAYNHNTKEIFVTGKYWPRMYRISIVEK